MQENLNHWWTENVTKTWRDGLGDGTDLMFLKEKKYQNQAEYRFIWQINSQFYKLQDFIEVECKEAVQFCERIKRD